jgi:hypothetical protein
LRLEAARGLRLTWLEADVACGLRPEAEACGLRPEAGLRLRLRLAA